MPRSSSSVRSRMHLEPVVVGVQLAFRQGRAGHDVEGANLGCRADLIHRRSLIPQCGVDEPFHAAVEGGEGVGRLLERERVRRDGGEVERPRASSAAVRRRRSIVQRPLRSAGIVDTCVLRIVSRRRWNSAPSINATGLVPYHEATSAVPSWRSRRNPSSRARGLPDTSTTRATPSVAPSAASAAASSAGSTLSTPSDAAALRRHASGSTADDARTGAPEQHGREDADGTEPEHGDRLVEQRAGVEADLQCGLDEREQRGDPRFDGGERDDGGRRHDEPILVGVEGEHRRAGGHFRPAVLDHADAAVAEAERETGTCRRARRSSRRAGARRRSRLGRRAARCRR